MTTQEQLAAIASMKSSYSSDISQRQTLSSICDIVTALLQNDYSNDADVQALTAQLAQASTDTDTANATIASMTTVLANLGYNPDGTAIAVVASPAQPDPSQNQGS